MSEKIRYTKTETSKMIDLLIALMALLVMAVYFYGTRVITLALSSILICVITDVLCSLMRHKKYKFELSSVVVGLTLTLLMPATVPYFVLMFAGFLGISIGKHVFGGTGNYIFNPTAVGYAFAVLCWGKQVLLFPRPFDSIPLSGEFAGTLSHSLGYSLQQSSLPVLSDIDMWLGRFVGPMGATHVIVLAVCAVFLIARKTVSGITFSSAVITTTALAALFPRLQSLNMLDSISYELVSGIFLFGLLFMASDPTTMPKTRLGRLWQGIALALLVFAYRHFGLLENSFVFALLIVNAMRNSFDKRFFHPIAAIKRKLHEFEVKNKECLDSGTRASACAVQAKPKELTKIEENKEGENAQ